MREPISSLPKAEILQLLKRAEDLGDLYLAIAYRDDLQAALPNRRIFHGDLVECLRYAERVVGVLVRRGQSGPDAWIATRGSNLTNQGHATANVQTKVVAKTFFNEDSLAQSQSMAMADVSEEEFDRAIERAKVEKNLSRTNVVKQLADKVPIEPMIGGRPRHLRKTRHISVRQVLDTTIDTISGVFLSLEALDDEDWKELSKEESNKYLGEFNDLVGELRKFRKKVADVSGTTLG